MAYDTGGPSVRSRNCSWIVCACAAAATRSATVTSATNLVLISVPSKCEIEPPFDIQFVRCSAGNNPRDAVITQPRGAAEDKRIARFEQQRLDGLAPLDPAEQEASRRAERDRHDR